MLIKKLFMLVEGDFVSTEDGSGIVHIAPAFGADDYEVSKKYNLPMLQPVTRGGLFTDEVTDFAGQFVKDADAGIIVKLKHRRKTLQKRNNCSHLSILLATSGSSGNLLCTRIMVYQNNYLLQIEWLN